MNLPQFLRDVNRFFFAPADTATFGLIRIAAGLMTFYVHLVYTADLQELFGKDAWFDHETQTIFRTQMPVELLPTQWEVPTELPPVRPEEKADVDTYKARWGLDPRPLHDRGQYLWSVWFHVTDPQTMAAVHAGFLVAMLLFALGLWTPITGTISWLAALSYVNRSHVSNFGMDTMMILALLYLVVGSFGLKPSASALSLDRWLWRYRMIRRGVADPEALGPTTSVGAGFAVRMIQIHFCIIYFAAGVSKLLGPMWWNGRALWWCLANYEFAPMDQPRYMSFLVWLSTRRWLWELFMTSQVIFTLTLEVGLPFLIWHPRLRWLMLIGAVFLHTGIALTMGLTGFGITMLTLLSSFLPPETVRHMLGLPRFATPQPVVV